MAQEKYEVAAVGTDNGRPVVFLTNGKEGQEVIVPTDNVTMATLAGKGFPIKNTNEVPIRRRR